MSNGDHIDKAIRLLKYLEKVTVLRFKPVRDIENYKYVLWLEEIPRDAPPGRCYTRAWGIEENPEDTDIWIQIKQGPEPLLNLQDIPDQCEQWVDQKILNDDATEPKLLSSIIEEEDNPEWTPGDPEEERTRDQVRDLRDYPEISKAWDNYITEIWQPWSERHRQWEPVHEVYSKLYSIHQTQLRLGEEYELVLGVGLLQWGINNYFCKRHIVVANVYMDFDAENGKFVIRPTTGAIADTDIISEEFDMLEAEHQPNLQAVEEMKEGLRNCDNLWDRAIIEPILTAIAHNLGENADGDYQGNNLERRQYGQGETRPLIDFAPALILRKKNTRRIQEIINDMKDQVQQDNNIPNIFATLLDIQNETDEQDDGPAEGGDSSYNTLTYFPLSSNWEQDKIIRFANANSGVLVQGPPGTGKSHTIANLICHFLATGKRILITAKTSRALKVLRNKLPSSVQSLCINLLDTGINDQLALEAGVEGILDKQYSWNDDDTQQDINQAYQRLDELKRKEAELKLRIRKSRESETYEHVIIDNTYQGTAAKIAQQIKQQESDYGWFQDDIPEGSECSFPVDYLIEFRNDLLRFTTKEQERSELELDIPFIDNYRDFSMLVQEEGLHEGLEQNQILQNNFYQILLDANNVEKVRGIIKKICQFNEAREQVSNIQQPQIETIISNALSNIEEWRHLFDNLPNETKIEDLKKQSDSFKDIYFDFPEDPTRKKRKKLLTDAKERFNHFKKNGKRGFWIFAPQIIRRTQYIEESVKVDSQECKTQELLEKVISYLELEQEILNYWEQLKIQLGQEITKEMNGPLPLQVIRIEKWRKTLGDIIGLYNYRDAANEKVIEIRNLLAGRFDIFDENAERPEEKFESIGEIAWHEEEVVLELLKVCQYYVSKKATQRIDEIQDDLKNHLKWRIYHPLAENLREAIISRDVNRCELIFKDIECLRQVKVDLAELEEVCPLFAKMIKEDREKDIEQKIYQIEKVWKWARAKSWLRNNYLNQDFEHWRQELQNTKKEIKVQIEKLASLEAWKFFFDRFTDEIGQHLVGWQQAIVEFGAGQGIHAGGHMIDAQEHLSHCLQAIPAWIMPLHKVYETVNVERKMFDVIIVDEASQCGLESFLLTYMGKQLIIVGDDQQISPDAVGIRPAEVNLLRHQYLQDFRHADLFSVKKSLFDYGRRMFGQNNVVLREHFRCMPEIISFSNKLFYQNRLIPLRQYPPERLEPLECIPVPEGYREGDTNIPEAEVIVDKIVECCRDPRYQDKTMGVIALQGQGQAGLIEKLLQNKLDAKEIEERNLICGNSSNFQGDERDIMFLSMVVDTNNQAFMAARYKRRFNVAASRAKDQMWLIHTATINDLSPDCLRTKLLKHFHNPQEQNNWLGEHALEELERIEHETDHRMQPPPPPYDSWFEVKVALMIAENGYKVIPQYPVAGYRIDLVVEGGRTSLAVECDGDHWHRTPEQRERDMRRQDQLEGAGWRFYRIRESKFNGCREEVWEGLQEKLQARGITPKN